MKRILIVDFCLSLTAVAMEFKVATDHPDALYRCGETATFNVSAWEGEAAATCGVFKARLDNFGKHKLSEAEIDLSKTNVFTMAGTLKTPGFLRLHVDGNKEGLPQLDYAVGYEPEKLHAAVARPADFDSFWENAMIKLEREVPLDPQIEKDDKHSSDKWTAYRVSFATFGNRRVHGYLSVPTSFMRKQWPVRVTVPGAGCGHWANQIKSAPDAICLFMTVFDYPPDDDLAMIKVKYDALNQTAKTKYLVDRYSNIGITMEREDYFYYSVILGINRAINWVAQRNDINRKSFSYQGTSQGGGMGLALCALNKNFTKAGIFVPAITDTLGCLQEDRQSGWPYPLENARREFRDQIIANAPYFDGVNFAKRITIPVRMTVGFADCTCPPHAVYSAYNALSSKDKEIWHGLGMGHGVRSEFYNKANSWIFKDQFK